jgi:hypothetical protein
MKCPSDNIQAVDQSSFWSAGSLHWDAHRIGWVVAGGCSVLVRLLFFPSSQPLTPSQTIIISAVSVLNHCRYVESLASCSSSAHSRRNYTKPAQQRQMYVYPLLPPPLPNPTRLSASQSANPVHAPCVCRHFVLLLPVLSKLYLLQSYPSRYVGQLIFRPFSDSPTGTMHCAVYEVCDKVSLSRV